MRNITNMHGIKIFQNKRRQNCNENTLNEWTSFILNHLFSVYPNNLHLSSFEHCHYIHQYDFIYDEYGNKIFDDDYSIVLLKTESLSDDFYDLLSLYNNTKVKITKKLIEKYHNNSQLSTCKNLNVSNINMTNMRLLQRFYHKDFIAFNYSMN